MLLCSSLRRESTDRGAILCSLVTDGTDGRMAAASRAVPVKGQTRHEQKFLHCEGGETLEQAS